MKAKQGQKRSTRTAASERRLRRNAPCASGESAQVDIVQGAQGQRVDKATSPPGRPQNEELDQAILSAALDAMSEVGFDALSITDVARRARTTPPAIYRRFADKTELLLAALAHDLATIANVDADQGSLRADLHWWLRSIFDALSPRRTRILASLNFQARTNPTPLALLCGTIHRLGSSRWRAIVQRAVQRGELCSNAIPEIIGKVPGALAVHMALFQEPPQDEDSITQLIDVVMLPTLFAAAAPIVDTEIPNNVPPSTNTHSD
jgi:AcrR family transcriptional regulator